MLENLTAALLHILTFQNLFFLLVGILLGYATGAIPGLSSSIAIALLIPFTFGMDPVPAIIMLVAIYMAADYAAAIPAILVNAPGQPAASVTAFDGYPMTQKGEAHKALAISLGGSAWGAFISSILLIFTAVLVARWALAFGPVEYFALTILGLSLVSVLSSGSMLKGILAMLLGLLLVTIGLDPMTGAPRFVLVPQMIEGIPFVPALIGLFAFSEVLYLLETSKERLSRVEHVGRLTIPFDLLKSMWGILIRAPLIGYLLGVLPGAGSTIASLVSYGEAKRVAKDPASFGKGNPAGVLASETANNASVSGALAPLLTLGIPGSASAAVLLGALMTHGIAPGPRLFTLEPLLPYSIFASLLIGAPIMLAIGLLGARLWVQVTLVPKSILAVAVAGVCVLGAYAHGSSMYPVWIMIAFGVIGYGLRKVGIHPAPIVLALVLGFIMEANFRRALLSAGGDYTFFLTRPLALVLFAIAILVFVTPIIQSIRQKRQQQQEVAQ